MSSINRFLSRRERSKGDQEKPPPPSPKNLQGLFANDSAEDKPKPPGPTAKVRERRAGHVQLKEVKALLDDSGISAFEDEDIKYVLRSSYVKGDTTRAFELLSLLAESDEGMVKPYDPNIRLVGAVNRHGVSCYLDSILFAMFARLESFEAMLYNENGDEARKRLSTLLRLWVNTLRVGQLITTDLTKQIQDSLAKCGWEDAAKVRQQDASEAFSFITEKLELPMLTLKMDIFHGAKEDLSGDHKLVRERLLEVAVPEEPANGAKITLEDCLEAYFNNRIEVKRFLERRGTINSVSSRQRSFDSSKGLALHVESVELNDSPPSTPSTLVPEKNLPPYSPIHSLAKNRSSSIIQKSYASIDDEKADLAAEEDSSMPGPGLRRRTVNSKKAYPMSAWQFFKLIPWHTDTAPSSDAEIAAHFSSTSPVLGICLKRYSILPNGEAVRRDTHIDIPTEIGLPDFIHDDSTNDHTATIGNFKLSLQSVVCHRGNSVHGGHYISIIRGQSSEGEESWLLFDDLNVENRIVAVDIERALLMESPYLLFYQVQAIEGDPGRTEDDRRPPSYYSESREYGTEGLSSSGLSSTTLGAPDQFEDAPETRRPSLEAPTVGGEERGRSVGPRERRRSVLFEDESTPAANKPDKPIGGPDRPQASRMPGRNSRSNSGLRRNSLLARVSHSRDRRVSSSFTRFAEKLAGVSKSDAIRNDTMADVVVAATANPEKAKRDGGGKGKERSRSRLGIQHLARDRRHEKPDRECVIM